MLENYKKNQEIAFSSKKTNLEVLCYTQRYVYVC